MPSFQDHIEANRAAYFDWLVLGISMALSFIFPVLPREEKLDWFSFLLFGALILYTTGSWLKHLPLSYRVTTAGEKFRTIPYVFFLVVGHWFIFIVVMIFSMGAVYKMFHIRVPVKDAYINSYTIPLCMLGSLLLTWMVYRTKFRLKDPGRYSKQFLFRRELVSDICLVVSVSVLSFIFWETGVMGMMVRERIDTFVDIIFLFFMMGILFMICYLPIRYLFLIEDHTSRQTWQRFLFIFGIFLVRFLFSVVHF